MLNKTYWILAAAFFAAYCAMMALSIVNLPNGGDDCRYILTFLNDWQQCAALSEKWQLLWQPAVGYRMVAFKLAVLLYWKIAGTANFAAFCIFGSICLAIMAWLLCRWHKVSRQSGLYALLVVLLLFNGQIFRSATWATSALHDLGTCMLAMLAIDLLLRKGRQWLIAGCMVSLLAGLCKSNGFALMPAVGIVLWLQNRRRNALSYAAFMCIAVVVFFIGWSLPQSHIEMSERTSIGFILQNIHVCVFNFFSMLGCFLYIPSLKIISFITGLCIVFTYIFALYRGYHKQHPQWFAFFNYILCTAAMLALWRSQMGTMWYRIHIAGVYVLATAFWMDYCMARKLVLALRLMPLAAIVFNAASGILYFNKMQQAVEQKQAVAYRYILSQDTAFAPIVLPVIEACYNYVPSMLAAQNNGIYDIPRSSIEGITSPICRAAWQDKQSDIEYNIDHIITYKGNMLISGYAIRAPMFHTTISLYLFNDHDTIQVTPLHDKRCFLDNAKQESGFFAIIPCMAVPAGSYTLGIEIKRRYTKRAYSAATKCMISI